MKLKKVLFLIGLFFFIVPIVSGLYKVVMENWDLFDWLIMYSYIYYPTYIIGLVFIVVSYIKK